MDKFTVIKYHYIRELKKSRYPFIKGLEYSLFQEQILYLNKHYNFICVEELIEAFHNNHPLPPKAVLITFDDAYSDHYSYVFPVLDKYNIKAAFYAPVTAIMGNKVLDVNKIHFILAATSNINSLIKEIKLELNRLKDAYNLADFQFYYDKLATPSRFDSAEIIFIKRLLQIGLNEKPRGLILDNLFSKVLNISELAFSRELYMSCEQLELLIRHGMHVGSHGNFHSRFDKLSKKKQEDEIQRSLAFIEKIGGDCKNWTMCYPYGCYNQDTIEILSKYQCKLGFTTEADVAKISLEDETKYKIPRLDTNDIPKNRAADVNQWYHNC
jgi:peptidoglycan/xylan/chitin deacetylase (PgdA/CDA1 family)